MARIKTGPRAIRAWLGGIAEDTEPAAFPPGADIEAPLDQCTNFAPTEAGRLAVRGGTASKAQMQDGAAHNIDKVLHIAPYSVTGACLTGHYVAGPGHIAELRSADFVSVSARGSLGWNTATAARPKAVELWEKMYIADATTLYANRGQAVSIDSAGTVSQLSYDLGAGSPDAFKPYFFSPYNGVLFAFGQDSSAGGGGTALDSPAMARHSFLGRSPDAANGFDKDAYDFVGSKGERITAAEAGKTVLLIAKQHELYRLSGAGRGRPGWQYATQPVDNTGRLGCSNPLALAFAEGYWYGTGDSGPWRSDGTTTELMLGPRRRSWGLVGAYDRAWVSYHPERRCVLFGYCTLGSTYPNTIWVWDILRTVWQGEWTPAAPVPHASSIAPLSYAGPVGVVTAITTDPSLSTLVSFSGSVTVSDPTADIEIWVNVGGSYVKDQTIAAGTTVFTSVNATTAASAYPVKARLVKNTISTAFSSETTGYTLLSAPALTFGLASQTTISLTVQNTSKVVGTVSVARLAPPATVSTGSLAPNGSRSSTDSGLICGTIYSYSATLTVPSWPALIRTATSGGSSKATANCGGGHA